MSAAIAGTVGLLGLAGRRQRRRHRRDGREPARGAPGAGHPRPHHPRPAAALVPESKVTPELSRRKSLGLHTIVFAVDECQELFTHPEYGKEAGELATAIIKRGPALGIILVLAT